MKTLKKIVAISCLIAAGCEGSVVISSDGHEPDADADGQASTDDEASDADQGDGGLGSDGGCACDPGRSCNDDGLCCVPLSGLVGSSRVGYDVEACTPEDPVRCHVWILEELDGDDWNGTLFGRVLVDGSEALVAPIEVTRVDCSAFQAVLPEEEQPSIYEFGYDPTSGLAGTFVWTYLDGTEPRSCVGTFESGC